MSRKFWMTQGTMMASEDMEENMQQIACVTACAVIWELKQNWKVTECRPVVREQNDMEMRPKFGFKLWGKQHG